MTMTMMAMTLVCRHHDGNHSNYQNRLSIMIRTGLRMVTCYDGYDYNLGLLPLVLSAGLFNQYWCCSGTIAITLPMLKIEGT